MHCSRSYHPQSQGKIERSHRVLHKKIHYDMIKLRKTGINWGHNLQGYIRVLNELARDEQCWKSPVEGCYGRIPKNIQKQVIEDERIIELPSARNFQER